MQCRYNRYYAVFIHKIRIIMQQLIKQIDQWAEERNLILDSTPQKQLIKLMEEFGDL